ncbi:LysR substrate-binding domain-containing protein [Streptomyces tsukubensis]|uniref:LysR family transcriptional regulator n=1 Tax=Streptomyces tsukubensis TaxID=83656 RepID=A0A1V4ADM3_9ACTN|nr:LysR substrate-binding domain-containing protein [Streptomyces tsukubensis]OON81688.1 LysR family transcriptional regulator [Streptomyces tsukubensis]QFR96463.1 LysR family transcriptional regulator [Streptomyces tsukubensis]
MTSSEASPPSFRLAYVPGVTPAKWVRIWNERLPDVPLSLAQLPPADAPGVLRELGADAGFVRLPIDRTDLSAIPLYTETTVVVLPKDHLFAAVEATEEVPAEDLADEVVLHPLDDTLDWGEGRPPGTPAKERPATTADAIELVAAGVGLLLVPQSLARLHARRDLTYRTVSGDDIPASRVALSWREEETTELVEEFIGIVRGRTVNSSRGRGAPAAQPQTKRAEKTGAKKKSAPARKPAGKNPRGGSGGSGARNGTKGNKGAKGGRGGGKGGKPGRRS